MSSLLKKMCAAVCSVLCLASCAGLDVTAYRDEKPALDLRQYFNGKIDAWGMFQDRSGKVIKRFHVVIDARWQGDKGTLDERFSYSDGSTQQRIWTLVRQPDGNYIGTAADVVGEARGELSGNALRWRYVMALPVDGKVYNVDFDDWMYLMDDKIMLNRSVMSKFGVRLGEVTLSFSKP
ncbi:DUF3833 domain-containing protein [Uliginosibacterium sediminicola]|uniref:DUF3833 domain-containing protein n=2 Tax=Uliginosibacterium sediminicola TaxID=2024550 RepID=A0ABU9YWP3_9RHOO